MSNLRTVLSASGVVAILGVGFGTWFAIATEKGRGEDLIKTMPELNQMKMEETRKRNALMMHVLKDAAESKDNMARDLRGPVK